MVLDAAVPAQARFSVFPTVIEVERARGDASLGSFNVRVEGEKDQRFAVGVQDVTQQSDGSFVQQPPSNSPFSASSWVSVTPQGFSGTPNRVQPVEYRILIPEKAEPGDHVTSLTLKRLPEKREGTATPIQAVSVRLTVRVAGTARPRANIISFDAPRLTDGDPLTISAVVRNTGNVRLGFDRGNGGSLTIASGSKRKAELPLRGTVYPGQERLLKLSWNSAPLVGRLKARAAVKVGRHVVQDSSSVLVVPWKEIAALILVALAVAVLALGARGGSVRSRPHLRGRGTRT